MGFLQDFSSEIETIVEDTDEAIRIQEELLDGDKGRAYYNNCCSGCIYSFTRTAFVCQMMFSISLIF